MLGEERGHGTGIHVTVRAVHAAADCSIMLFTVPEKPQALCEGEEQS